MNLHQSLGNISVEAVLLNIMFSLPARVVDVIRHNLSED